MMDETLNFSGSSIEGCNNVKMRYSAKEIGNKLSDMLDEVGQNDPKRRGSSEQYRKMKESLTELNDMVNGTWQKSIEADEPVTFDMMNDPESYEQKRIKTNIDNLRELDKMTNIVEQDILKGISVKAKEYFNNDLEVPEAQRSRLPKGDLDPIGVNVMRTVDRQSQLSDDAFTRRYKGGRKES